MGERRGRGNLWCSKTPLGGFAHCAQEGGGKMSERVGGVFFWGGVSAMQVIIFFLVGGDIGLVGGSHTAYSRRGEAPDKNLFSDSFLTFTEHKNSHDRGRLTGRGVYCLINLPNRERRRHTYMQSRF